MYRSPYACGVPRSSHVLFAAYHKARPSRAINEDVYYYYYYYYTNTVLKVVCHIYIGDSEHLMRRPLESYA